MSSEVINKENKMTYVILTAGWNGLSIAYHLQEEGCEVLVGEVQNLDDMKCGEIEKPEDKEERLTQYDGMLKKIPIDNLIKALLKVKDKENYFIFCDFNKLWRYSEILVKAGFTNGLFPLKEDYDFEKDRELAMQFVKDNYKEIKLIPSNEFKTVEESIKFLEENEGVYVIQSDGDHVNTYVPQTDEPEIAKEQSICQLNKYKSEYEKGGLIIKTKLINPVEITPEIVFYNGEVVFTDIDIETKNIGDGENNGPQVGCGTNLIIKTDLEEKINKLSFPEAVYAKAKERKGMFVWDISLYVMPDGIYFGEFCPNRVGYDAVFSEIDMSGGVSNFFEGIMNKKNPLTKKFGVIMRLFNIDRKGDKKVSCEGIEDKVYLYEVKKDGEDIVTVKDCYELAVITNSGDTIEDSINELYNIRKCFSCKDSYNRTKTDFFGIYPTSILQRYNEVNHKFFNAPDVKIPVSFDDIKNITRQVIKNML
jgi:hypothetical protein